MEYSIKLKYFLHYFSFPYVMIALYSKITLYMYIHVYR